MDAAGGARVTTGGTHTGRVVKPGRREAGRGQATGVRARDEVATRPHPVEPRDEELARSATESLGVATQTAASLPGGTAATVTRAANEA